MELAHGIQSLFAFLAGFFSIIWASHDSDNVFPVSTFSTKTGYRHCGLMGFEAPGHKRLEKCALVHTNVLLRHGTRSPSKKDVSKFEQLYNRLVASDEAILPDGFRGYPIPFKNEGEKVLLHMGFEEHYDLGRRFRKQAKSFFKIAKKNIRFYASSTERTLDSARSFYDGFFGKPRPNPNDLRSKRPIHPHASAATGDELDSDAIEVADELLRFFDFCRRYEKEIEGNKSCVVEHSRFRTGPEMQQVLKEVVQSHRLERLDLSTSDLYIIYLACAFEIAAFPDSNPRSPWCNLLKPRHIPVFEYLVDLKQYWLKSYGYKLNYVQSCPLVGEILTQLEAVANSYSPEKNKRHNKDLHRASFWFGHAETLLPVVAAFGLFNDSVGEQEPKHLFAKDFEKWLERSKDQPQPPTMFRAGHIAPFAGNLALNLFYCADSATTGNSLSGFYVQPILNGKSVAWPIASIVQPPTSQNPGGNFAPLSIVLREFRTCMPGVYDNDKVCAWDPHSGRSGA